MKKYKFKLIEHGFLANIVAMLFRFFQWLPFQSIIGNRPDSFRDSNFEKLSPAEQKKESIKRSYRIDQYVSIFILIEFFCIWSLSKGFWGNCYAEAFIRVIMILRIVDIFQVNINLAIFDALRTKKPNNIMASVERTLVNTAINYFELILCFSVLYGTLLGNLTNANTWTDALYFSSILQLTLGFENIFPVNSARIIAVIHLAIAFFFGILILARFISLLPAIKAIAGDGQYDDPKPAANPPDQASANEEPKNNS